VNLARDVKGKKKVFYRYINGKKKTRENVGPLLNGVAGVVTNDTEKAKVLNTFFALVFTGKTGLQESRAPETRGEDWNRES